MVTQTHTRIQAHTRTQARAHTKTEPKTKVEVEEIWAWLEDVSDPEIPVLSVVDLGVIRDIKWKGKQLEVGITPTYCGCPAMSVITKDVENKIRSNGIKNVSVKTQLSPAWTTEWMSQKGKKKLEEYGIAPPQKNQKPKRCPKCQAEEVVRISQFGSTPCKAQWQCQKCKEPFDYFKCI